MIAYSFKNNKDFQEFNWINKIEPIKEDINLIYDFSSILEVISIQKLEDTSSSFDLLYLIKMFENYMMTNDYHDICCPLCGNKNTLSFHKTYQRDFVFYINNYEITAIISLPVVECSYCKEKNKISERQHFHAILPDFIFPYHLHSSDIILDTIYQRIVNHIKLNAIISKRKISHQLLYSWIKGMEQYQLSSSTILGIPNNLQEILKDIRKEIKEFLSQFYSQYHHPFFLFRFTCVPLVIIP